MGEQKSGDCKDGSCPVDKAPKLVKATDLPITGNPYPPKDVVVVDKPGFMESQIKSFRTALQPVIRPISSAYEHTSDFVSIGVAHSQSAVQRLAENQNSVTNSLIIASAGILGVALARKRGIFKKLLFGSVFFGGAMAACYPKDTEEKAQILWYIAKNKLPSVAKQQYDNLFAKSSQESQSSDPNESGKQK